jgi:hypothetical protein
MLFAYFTLFVALVISAVAEYYSIVGLTSIFSTVFWPIVIMGAVLGVGKITAAVWLKLNWDRASFTYKLYLVPAVAFLMLLTSMGIFGFLSKAHSDQSLVSGDSMSNVAIFDEKIKTARENIDTNRKSLLQLDEQVNQTLSRTQAATDNSAVNRSITIRRQQTSERTRLQKEITEEQKTIVSLTEQRAPLAAEFRKVEAEVGPIKYIAAMIYGDNPDTNILEKAVRLVIILIVAVFDPLALVLILAAQQSIKWAREDKKSTVDDEMTAVIIPTAADVEPIAPKVPAEPQTTVDPIEPAYPADDGPLTNKQIEQIKESVDRYAYLKKPFVHFANTAPMVATTVDPDWHSIMDDVAAMSIDPNPPGVIQREWTPDEIVALEAVPVRRPESAPGRNRGVMYTPPITADNADSTGNASRTDFGNEYPANPSKGDVYLRIDYLPNRLFKYNGAKWIEVDKSQTDVYAYDELYIKYLIDQIAESKYDADSLTDVEREQIAEYLKRNAS